MGSNKKEEDQGTLTQERGDGNLPVMAVHGLLGELYRREQGLPRKTELVGHHRLLNILNRDLYT